MTNLFKPNDLVPNHFEGYITQDFHGPEKLFNRVWVYAEFHFKGLKHITITERGKDKERERGR